MGLSRNTECPECNATIDEDLTICECDGCGMNIDGYDEVYCGDCND